MGSNPIGLTNRGSVSSCLSSGYAVDQETINGLADLIAQKLPIPVWWLIAIQAALTLLAAGVGAFFGEYLRIRGRNLATKADFNSLSAQLQANTETVEKIKSNVAQRDW